MTLKELEKELIVKALTRTKGNAFEAWKLVYPNEEISLQSFKDNLYKKKLKLKLSDFSSPGKETLLIQKVRTVKLNKEDINKLIEREYNKDHRESVINYNYRFDSVLNQKVLKNVTIKIVE